jgi:hypothetical protein
MIFNKKLPEDFPVISYVNKNVVQRRSIMDTLYKQFVQEYEDSVDIHIYNGDDQRSVNNPALFVFIGDKITEGLKFVYEDIKKKCNNSK